MNHRLVLAVAALSVAPTMSGCDDYTPSPKAQARHAIDYCWEDQKRKSLTPAEQRFIAGACEKMERDFTQTYGHRP